MTDTSWEYIIPGGGIYNDTSEDSEPLIPGVGVVNEGETTIVGGGPRANPFGHPFDGPLGGVI